MIQFWMENRLVSDRIWDVENLLVMACVGHRLVDYIIQQKHIEHYFSKVQWILYFTLMIVNDTLYVFLRMKLLWR